MLIIKFLYILLVCGGMYINNGYDPTIIIKKHIHMVTQKFAINFGFTNLISTTQVPRGESKVMLIDFIVVHIHGSWLLTCCY